MNETRHIDGHDIELSHLDKVYFPESGITKKDVVDYFEKVAPYMLPQLKDRPLSMQRYPEGIRGEGFYQQDMPDYFPDWIARVEVPKEAGIVTHVVCNDAATLVYLANQGFLIPHMWLSHADRLSYPDRLVVDLDPPDDFDKPASLQATALRLRDRFHDLGLTAYVNTTGSTGYHIYVPLEREMEFHDVRDFAHDVVSELAERYPDELTVEHRINKRGRRIFLDTLRNSYAHTVVAPYSIRARDGAPVATPLSWSELESKAVGPQRYNIKNLFRHLGNRKDPWAGMDSHAGSVVRAREKMSGRK